MPRPSTHRPRKRVSKKSRKTDLAFWLIHSSHWIAAFVFIFLTLTTIYVFFAGDAAFAESIFPTGY